ncbi:hypothetical protein [Candidatus Viridilinea mediisalina]|uniref:Uncharacterized protein n=1 Tax=Candidatus Viridilinea mediisalina TaxID=2024553 RepID=A0A2A6RKY2_9CHLR|nr:hypothetical protein [Candidatus Viridilinea mediisalina]PDW03737.1 hypothetical protein CJ255_07080 [Candidatus Viridilinea mediisalina]
MTTALFEQTLTLAHQLTSQEQARLIEALARTLAMTVQPSTPHAVDSAFVPAAWTRLFAFSDELRATYPEAHPAARLETDRCERTAITQGDQGLDDVHP